MLPASLVAAMTVAFLQPAVLLRSSSIAFRRYSVIRLAESDGEIDWEEEMRMLRAKQRDELEGRSESSPSMKPDSDKGKELEVPNGRRFDAPDRADAGFRFQTANS